MRAVTLLVALGGRCAGCCHRAGERRAQPWRPENDQYSPVMNASRAVPLLVLGLSAAAATYGQEAPVLDVIVERLGAYLAAYESTLGAIVADERYGQETRRGTQTSRRRLESEVTFLRLPGGREWFGIRDVRKVNGKAVPGTGTSLSDLLKSPGQDMIERAAAIVEASSRHNLGGQRTINMPTVPLEVLCVQNHPRLIFKLRGRERVRGIETERLEYEEFDEPTLVRSTDGGTLWSRGTAWIERDTGRLWRAELVVGPDAPGTFRRTALEARIRVEFVHDATLDLVVPKEMVEDFWIPRGRGTGRAQYSNFRRFSTSARIIP